MAATDETHDSGDLQQDGFQPHGASSVVLPLFAIMIGIAVPVTLAALSAAGGGIVAVAFGLLATVGILYGLTRFMMAIMGGEA